MSEPIPAEHLADIRRRNDISLRLAENPAYALDQAEDDRRLLLAEVERLRAELGEVVTALRLTHEYVGIGLLPARAGWSWYDALSKHCPEYVAGVYTAPFPLRAEEVGE